MKPLAPSTVAAYRALLLRAYGSETPSVEALAPDVADWPESVKRLLRAATRRQLVEAGAAPEDVAGFLRAIPARWEARRATQVPTEDEALAYEAAANTLPRGRRALALLPLAMGLRAREVVTLPRAAVERAAQRGELKVLRKGGAEQVLPAAHALGLFAELLEVPAALVRGGRTHAWAALGEVLSPLGTPRAAYKALHTLVRHTGRKAGLPGLRPHQLRHAFATRMSRDGAPLPAVQWALGHARVTTTMLYVHPTADDVKQYLRPY